MDWSIAPYVLGAVFAERGLSGGCADNGPALQETRAATRRGLDNEGGSLQGGLQGVPGAALRVAQLDDEGHVPVRIEVYGGFAGGDVDFEGILGDGEDGF